MSIQHKNYIEHTSYNIRDLSLITGRGGATKREGGQVKFYPYENGSGKSLSFSHAEGGGGAQQVLW